MYKLDETVWLTIRDNIVNWWQNGRKVMFPWSSFSIFIVQFLFLGVLGGIFYKILSGKRWWPEYH